MRWQLRTGAETTKTAQRRYVEPARSYASSLVLLTVLVIGFLVDLLALGGGRIHALAWALAIVLVVGIDALITYAARSLRSIVVTDDELRVGEETVPRNEILGLRLDPGDGVPVLGRRVGEGLPRGTAPLTLQLIGDRAVVIATRDPQRLSAALAIEEVLPEIRPAEPADLLLLPDIDRRAESLFHVSGMNLPEIPFPVDALHESEAVFVAGRPPIAFVQLDRVDGNAHVQELAVLPAHMRQGVGSGLLDTACAWAKARGYQAITLTTYAEITWNAPFYQARGFVEMTELTPELTELRTWERDMGLDALGRRIAMRRDL